LKPENILIEKIKIIVLETAKILEKNAIYNKLIGSSYYMAPEILNCNYNEKCD
jgi:serine/threonine protein kinase